MTIRNLTTSFLALITLALSASSARADLVGLYRFENAANLGQDSSTYGNHLTAYGDAVTQNAGGQIGSALSLGGSNDWLGIAGDGGGDNAGVPTGVPTGGSSYTIAAWIKPDAAVGSSAGIIGWGNYGTNNQVNAFRLDSTDGLNNYWWGNDLNNGDVLAGADQFNDGQWWHVAVTYDAAAALIDHTIYVNGVPVLDRNSNNAINVAAENFRIGVTNGLNEDWLGLLDDVAIFNQALSQAQIQAIAGGDFSAFGVPVPEPSAAALWLIAGIVALCWRKYRRR